MSAPASPAGAAVYEVFSCGAAPDYSAAAWTAAADPGMAARAQCPWNADPSRGMVTRNSTDGRFRDGDSASLTMKAPPGTALEDITFSWVGHRESGGWSVGLHADGRWLAGCRAGVGGACELGDGGNVPQTLPLAGASEVTLRTACGANNGCDAATPGSGPGGAQVSLTRSVVRVRDDLAPLVGDVSGSLWHGDWLRGEGGVAFDAADGAGIAVSRVLVDGASASRSEHSCEYTRSKPCPDAHEEHRVDTSGLPDGRHTATVEVTDGAGNTTVLERAIDTDNHAPEAYFLPRDPGAPREVAVAVADSASGVAAGAIEVQRRGSGNWKPLGGKLDGTRLVAQLPEDLDPGDYEFRATVRDRVGLEIVTDRMGDGSPYEVHVERPPVSDLRIDVRDAPDPVLAGERLTYTLTVSNRGEAAEVARVTGGLPADVAFVSASSNCTFGSGRVLCATPAPLEPGRSAAFEVVVRPNRDGVVTNTVTVDGDGDGDDVRPGDNASTAKTVVRDPYVDLVLEQSDAPDPVAKGSRLTYTLTVTNRGETAQPATLQDTLPRGTSFVSAAAGCAKDHRLVTCRTAAPLPPGARAEFEVVVRADEVGELVSRATVAPAAPDDSPADNEATEGTTVTAPASPPKVADLAVRISDAPDPVTKGGRLTYSLAAINRGDLTQRAKLEHALPTGARFVSATPGCAKSHRIVTCRTGAPIAPGTRTAFDVVVRVDEQHELVSSASVAGEVADARTADNEAIARTAVTAPAQVADLRIDQADTPDPVTAGDRLTYTLTVSNEGEAEQHATVRDTLPGAVSFVSAPTGCSQHRGVVTCRTASPLPAGGRATLAVIVRADSAGEIENGATVSGDLPDARPGDNVASERTVVKEPPTPRPPPVADVALDKSDSPDPVVQGGRIAYRLTVTNRGETEEVATVGDPLPAGVSFLSAGPGCGFAGGTVSCTTAPMAPGDSASFEIVVRADRAGRVTNTATVALAAGDDRPQDNTATESTDVDDPPPPDPPPGSPPTSGPQPPPAGPARRKGEPRTRLTAGIVARKGGTVARRKLGRGRSARVRGRLMRRGGRPVTNGTVVVSSRLAVPGAEWRPVGEVRTGRAGGFRYRVPVGPSRSLRFEFRGPQRLRPSADQVAVDVPAASSIEASRRRAAVGDVVEFSGGLRGGPVQPRGKLIDLQAYYRGQWRSFALVRTDARGQWSHDYRFRATQGVVRYPFRARVPREADYPYGRGRSRVVRVVVDGRRG